MRTLLRDDAFQIGALVSLGIAAIVVALRRGPWWRGCALLAVPVGTLAGLDHQYSPPVTLFLAVLAFALVGRLSAGWWLPVRVAAGVPGALLLVHSLPSGIPTWAVWLAAVGAVLGGARATAVDRRFPRLTPLLLAGTACGVYLCVPETSTTAAAAPVGAAIAPVILALAVRRGVRPSPGATFAAVGLFAWIAAVGGSARPGAVVGAMACLGVLLVGWRPRAALRSPRASKQVQVIWLVIHAAIVLWASRVAGLRQSGWTAAGLVIPVLAVGAVAGWWAARRVSANVRPVQVVDDRGRPG